MQSLKEITKSLKRQGYRVEKGRRSTHTKVYDKDGKLITTFAGTPSDHRAIRNIIGYLKRAGVQL